MTSPVDALHHVERRADHRLVVAGQQHARRAHGGVLRPRSAAAPRAARRGRRAAAAAAAGAAARARSVAAADQVGDVGVALADRLGLDRPACRARGRPDSASSGRRTSSGGSSSASASSRVSTIAVTRRDSLIASLEGRTLWLLEGVTGVSPCVPPLPHHRTPRAARRSPAAASASSTQSLTFEAPRELLDPSTRDRTLDEIRAFGVDRVRVLVYWQNFAPAATLQAAPGLRRHRPGAPTRPARGSRLDALFEAAGARGDRRPAHAHRAGPALGDREQARQRDEAEPEGVRGVRDRRRAALRRPRRPVVDLERAEPPAVPAPAVRAQEARQVAAHLPQPLPRRPARPARLRATAPTRCCSARPRRAAPRASSRRSRSCAARCA